MAMVNRTAIKLMVDLVTPAAPGGHNTQAPPPNYPSHNSRPYIRNRPRPLPR